MSDTQESWLLYDGECPFCRSYIHFLRLRESIGPVRLIDARQDTPERKQVADAGLDLDEGMVLHLEGQLYHGAACLNRLSLMSTGSGFINGLFAKLFTAEARARRWYPWLRGGRNLALRLLGRKQIGA
jgi:predicted DCC family thiol-disulfide oxidoreductase YuxK